MTNNFCIKKFKSFFNDQKDAKEANRQKKFIKNFKAL